MHAHSVWIYDKHPGKQTTLGSSTVLLNHMLRSPAFSVEWKNGRACYMRLQPYWAMLVHASIQTKGSFLVHPTQDLQRQQELLASGAASTARLASALVPWCPFLKLFWLDTKSCNRQSKVAAAAAAASAAASVSLATPTLDATQKHWKRGTVGGQGQGYPFSKASNRGFCF